MKHLQKKSTIEKILTTTATVATSIILIALCVGVHKTLSVSDHIEEPDTEVLLIREPAQVKPSVDAMVYSEPIKEEDTKTVEEPEDQGPTTYTIQYGDSLWRIADKFYGDGTLYAKVAASNNIKSTDVIVPGQVITIYDAIYLDSVEVPKEEYKETSKTNSDVNVKNNTSGVDTSNMSYVGNYRITGYDPYCSHCCGKVTGIGASGRQIDIGYSVGCNDIPLGTELYIEGYGFYRVDDNGGGGGGFIDIACSSHDACYKVTNKNIPIYIVNA